MARLLLTLALGLVLSAAGAHGCSSTCSPDATVMSRDFSVEVRSFGAPLEGAQVKIYADAVGGGKWSGTTDRQGIFSPRGLRPGRYWIDVARLGVPAGSGCFRVARFSRGAGGKWSFNGERPPSR